MNLRLVVLVCVLAALLVGCGSAETSASQDITVSAASSLTEAVTEIARKFEAANPGVRAHLNFASSGVLQKQIEQGAPADVFISASSKEMDALQRERLIVTETRANIAANKLVLIAPASTKLEGWDGLARSNQIAISNPDTVPSGRYARQTLRKLGLWDKLQHKLVLGENVRQTLAYVSRGDVDAGIVFATDARIEKDRVKIVAEAKPGVDHDPIAYPAALVAASSKNVAARRFLDYLRSPDAGAVLASFGFSVPMAA